MNFPCELYFFNMLTASSFLYNENYMDKIYRTTTFWISDNKAGPRNQS